MTVRQTIEKIIDIIKNRECVQHVFLNANKINLLQTDEELRRIVNQSPLINADGASIVWAGKLLGIPITERVNGTNLFIQLIEIASKSNLRVFMLGAKQEVIEKVKERFLQTYPSLQIAGIRNGYFSREDEPEIAEQIARSSADMLFVGFSSPQKEFWIHRNLTALNVPFVMGVGGSFDVVAGVVKRAPVWMQGHGLEWLFRFFQEPRRMWKRYLVGNAKFIALTYKTRWAKRRNGKSGEYIDV